MVTNSSRICENDENYENPSNWKMQNSIFIKKYIFFNLAPHAGAGKSGFLCFHEKVDIL